MAQDPAPGSLLFAQKCTVCHGASRALDGARKIAPADRAAQLERFLSTHFCRDAEERKAIVEYLATEVSRDEPAAPGAGAAAPAPAAPAPENPAPGPAGDAPATP